jgi:hypothetical protein
LKQIFLRVDFVLPCVSGFIDIYYLFLFPDFKGVNTGVLISPWPDQEGNVSPGTCNPEKTGLPRLPLSWSPILFSGSGPVGLPPAPWTQKTIEREVGRAKDLSAPGNLC